MSRRIFCLVLAVAAALAACGQISEKQREREDIEKALKQYIDQQPGFEAQTAERDVRVFNVDRDRAEVVVEFTARSDGSIRRMLYHLRRQGTVWTVQDAKPYTPRLITQHIPQVQSAAHFDAPTATASADFSDVACGTPKSFT